MIDNLERGWNILLDHHQSDAHAFVDVRETPHHVAHDHGRNVMRRLAEINERMGVGLIVVEQNVPATLKMVQQTMILRSGRIAFQGSAEELSGNTDLWKWF